MTDAATILDTGATLARKYAAVRRPYVAVRYGTQRDEEEMRADRLALYGLMRLEELDVERLFGTDGALALLVLHGDADQYGAPATSFGRTVLGYHCLRRHYRLGTEDRSTVIEAIVRGVLNGCPRTPTGTVCLPGERLRVELMLCVPPLLSMAGLILGRPELHDEAVRQVRGLNAELRDERSGLYHHTRNWFRTNEVTPDGWARGNGYAAVGLVEVLRFLPFDHPAAPELRDGLRAHLLALAATQTEAGLFRQVLADDSSAEETSGSALIIYALATAVQRGWIGEEYRARVERGWVGLAERIELSGNASVAGTTVSTPPSREASYYRERPTAQNDPAAFGPLLLACCACYELARSRRWDRPVESLRRFPPPDDDAVRSFFMRCHHICDRQYNGDGSWGKGTADDPEGTFDEIIKESQGNHPIVRYSAFAAMGYFGAADGGAHDVPAGRADEALAWLVRNQEDDGSYRLWTRHANGQVGHDGCLFETGLAGSALVSGYEHRSDPALLAASARTARWESCYPIVRNTNFNAFAVWHLARHYEISADRDALYAAVHRARYGMLATQQPAGGWPGHNSMVWYHGINVRAYATLLRALPRSHEFRRELEPALRASLNHVASLQLSDGSLLHRPGSNEVAQQYAQVIVALAESVRVLPDDGIRDVLNGVVAYRMSPEAGDPDRMYNQEKGYWIEGWSSAYVYAYGVYLRTVRREHG